MYLAILRVAAISAAASASRRCFYYIMNRWMYMPPTVTCISQMTGLPVCHGIRVIMAMLLRAVFLCEALVQQDIVERCIKTDIRWNK